MRLMFIGGKRIWVSRKNFIRLFFFLPFWFLDILCLDFILENIRH